uniref:Uncharacterized protein n=1 Tax=Oryza glumipatula TaxID=40148 RepID=A0A0D9Y8A7_9ORYZ
MQRSNERGRCGRDSCTARCGSDATATATARSLLWQLSPPVATFSPALGGRKSERMVRAALKQESTNPSVVAVAALTRV